MNFIGGCSVFSRIEAKNKIGADVHQALITMWQSVMNGEIKRWFKITEATMTNIQYVVYRKEVDDSWTKIAEMEYLSLVKKFINSYEYHDEYGNVEYSEFLAFDRHHELIYTFNKNE